MIKELRFVLDCYIGTIIDDSDIYRLGKASMEEPVVGEHNDEL